MCQQFIYIIFLSNNQVLHTKLSKKSDADDPFAELKSLVLYDGSITDFDSRMFGFDIGTCLEVILSLFPDLVLIVSLYILEKLENID